ncbi:MAG TPA: putative sugar nucleotidyl transferase [Nitrososphaera sp.]|jgi:UDP-N-acetylglucosamine diphosphorylase / glucose-1-phosphate thymidylyltransferase / UDP-N-acetylgalactosamine diphosphorylase / glucosamine-1-phosphate N-acetyltransferase / galactosamine-1-phosphate N-acetyltransferase|nr:putative sugar nucleotidyl transferase [Nitrososphaera sp.]
MSIALFEDSHWQNFEPISLTKATFDIKVGAKSFFEEHQLAPEILLTREYLACVTAERHPNCKVNPSSISSDTVFVNGLLHPGAISPDRLFNINHTFAITASRSTRLLVARLDSKDIEYLQDCVTAGKRIDIKKLKVEKLTNLENQDTQGILSEPWDIISVLENSLATQVSTMKNETQLGEEVAITGNNIVALGRNASVEVGTVLDVRYGGIYIGPGAYVAASRIVGPTYIDGMAQVKQFTIIEASYIGYNCRIGGEVEHSVISDDTNKAHAGFIGHSYIGEWVNIGAMTTTSDLKMTYGNIKMSSGKNKKIDTGQNKIGSFFADMVKTSIGTLIYSGRRIGVSSHLHGLVAQDVPSFAIYGTSIGARNVELQIDSIIETQRKMMTRRNQTMTKAYEQMIKDLFAITALDRKRTGVRRGKFAL